VYRQKEAIENKVKIKMFKKRKRTVLKRLNMNIKK
jgi:hypothetical protein